MCTHPLSTFVALAVLVIPTLALAQSDTGVRGQVVADTNRSALSEARLTLQEDGRDEPELSTTDDSGAFAFGGVRPGTYALTAEYDGFVARTVRFVLKPRELKTIELTLAIRPVEERVDVSASITLASTFSPSSTVVSTALLDTLPAAQRTSLSDAIVVAAPGMIRGHDDFVHVRGQELALNPMINGVSFWENPHAVFSGGVSPEVIDTANVMTGGFPAEYGNRFGGVVDIVTKSGFAMNHHGSVTVNAGEASRNTVSGELGGHTEKVAYYAFGSAFESDRFLSPPDPAALHDHGDGGRGFFQLDAAPTATDSVRLTLMADGTNFDVPVTPLDEELRPAAKASQATRQQSVIVGWNRVLSSNALLHTSFYGRRSRARLFPASGPLTAVVETDRRLSTFGVKTDLSLSLSNHTVKMGVDLVRLRPDEHLVRLEGF